MFFNIKIFFLTVLLIISSGCSFSPLYNNHSLSSIVFLEPKKSNKDLHNIYRNLDRLFFTNSASEKKYIVSLSLEKRFDDIDVRQDEKVTRMGISKKVTFTLSEIKSKKIIFSGESSASIAFNRVSEPYSNETAKTDSENRLAYSLAQDIRNQLVLLRKQKLTP